MRTAELASDIFRIRRAAANIPVTYLMSPPLGSSKPIGSLCVMREARTPFFRFMALCGRASANAGFPDCNLHYDRPTCASAIRRSMILDSRSQDDSSLFCGDVAMPSSRPDRAEAVDAYQSDSGVGDIPSGCASLAMERSGTPSGNGSTAANPAMVALLARARRHFNNASPCAA